MTNNKLSTVPIYQLSFYASEFWLFLLNFIYFLITGEQLKTRVKKICEGFRATLYPCPDQATDRYCTGTSYSYISRDLNSSKNVASEWIPGFGSRVLGGGGGEGRGGMALASVDLAGGLRAVQVSGNLGLGVSP